MAEARLRTQIAELRSMHERTQRSLDEQGRSARRDLETSISSLISASEHERRQRHAQLAMLMSMPPPSTVAEAEAAGILMCQRLRSPADPAESDVESDAFAAFKTGSSTPTMWTSCRLALLALLRVFKQFEPTRQSRAGVRQPIQML
eukprot:5551202-Pleurochrysis_carterae.AAC.1